MISQKYIFVGIPVACAITYYFIKKYYNAINQKECDRIKHNEYFYLNVIKFNIFYKLIDLKKMYQSIANFDRKFELLIINMFNDKPKYTTFTYNISKRLIIASHPNEPDISKTILKHLVTLDGIDNNMYVSLSSYQDSLLEEIKKDYHYKIENVILMK